MAGPLGWLRRTFTPDLTLADSSAACALSDTWTRRTSRVSGSSAASRGGRERSAPTSKPTASSVNIAGVPMSNMKTMRYRASGFRNAFGEIYMQQQQLSASAKLKRSLLAAHARPGPAGDSDIPERGVPVPPLHTLPGAAALLPSHLHPTCAVTFTPSSHLPKLC